MLSVAVLAPTGTAGDALDNAFFVLGPTGGRAYLRRLPETEVMFFRRRRRERGRSCVSHEERSDEGERWRNEVTKGRLDER